MSGHFNMGDHATINRPDRRSHGWEVVIIGPLHLSSRVDRSTNCIGEPEMVYSIEYVDPAAPPPVAKSYAARPDELRPIDPGREVVSWDTCVWRPKETA